MAAADFYPNGLGGTSGADLATVSPIYTTGDVWYVSSSSGADAVSPRGKDRAKPLATLSQALTNAAAGDTIVLLSGHSESISGAITSSLARINIVGEGTGTSRPRFTRSADIVMFTFSGAGVTLDNIYFVASSTSSTNSRVKFSAARPAAIRLYFECGSNDAGPALETVTGASQLIMSSVSFVSTSTSSSSQPDHALRFTNAITDVDMNTVIFDGNTSGWANQYALQGTGAVTGLRAINIDLLNDSDVTLATSTSGYMTIRNKSGSAKVKWTP